MTDTDPLLDEASPRWRRRSAFICLAIFSCGCLALASAIIASYFLLYHKNVVGLRVMSLNTWGMPKTFGSEDKSLRMEAIGQHIQKGEYDVYLLEELWMRPDHNMIKSLIPEGYYMTEVGDLASSCDGTIGPDGCSGLAIVSKYPFLELNFHGYSDHGDAIWFDGEYLARKGVGHARIEPAKGYIVDMFVTHTCASDYNYYYRQRQVKELVEIVENSDADFVVLGGDFNVDPKVNANETTLPDIQNIMVNSIEDFFKTIETWLVPSRATYGNPANTYSSKYSPVLYDYIFHKPRGKNMIWTNYFEIPFLRAFKDNVSEVSFSDHEAVTAKLHLWKSVV
eukprot:GFUD01028583.1.p1 GENE.GFUD01028583.1~~GFUD01028583.1.p1  ORF type:complete len:338 (-),score=73.61 GFUD01028583.1:163-1176(-)